jgi:hypothetical protein
MTKAELIAREAEIRANDIAEANRELNKERAISRLMLSGMTRKDAQREFNDQVAYFMRGIDGYDRPDAIDAAAEVILDEDEMDESYFTMLDLMHN